MATVGRRLDEQLILELEKALLTADVGVAATARLVDGIRTDYKAGKLTRGEDVLDYLKRELKAMWPPEDRRLHFAPAGTPKPVVEQLYAEMKKAVDSGALRDRLRAANDQVELVARPADEFRSFIAKETQRWRGVTAGSSTTNASRDGSVNQRCSKSTA